MTDDERMNRATRAKEVLGNEAFMATLESLEIVLPSFIGVRIKNFLTSSKAPKDGMLTVL